MTKTFKKSVAFISAAVMVMTMLLYFPSGIFSIDFGLKASAAATITLSAPTEGDGSSDNPYQISTKEELYWFAACVNGTDGVTRNTAANAVLTADIVVNENVLNADGTPNGTDFTSWTPISTSSSKGYTGTFDGKNHKICGLYFNDTSKKYVGSHTPFCNVPSALIIFNLSTALFHLVKFFLFSGILHIFCGFFRYKLITFIGSMQKS